MPEACGHNGTGIQVAPRLHPDLCRSVQICSEIYVIFRAIPNTMIRYENKFLSVEILRRDERNG